MRPIVAFLLVASFGILFAGCSGDGASPDGESSNQQADEFTFTADDIERVRKLVDRAGTGSTAPQLSTRSPHTGTGDDAGDPPVLNVRGQQRRYDAIRGQGTQEGKRVYRVVNPFLNVRAEPRVTAQRVGRLEEGESVDLLEFVNAAWAHVRFGEEGEEGYVSTRYIARVVSEEQLDEARNQYEGRYYVDFGFLNVRENPDTQSEKIGELDGQEFVTPLSMDDVWARIPFEDGEGYVAVEYLSPFEPDFLVRQSTFNLPVLLYQPTGEAMLRAMAQHLGRLQKEGYNFMTMQEFHDLLLSQENRDVRLKPDSVVVGVTGITPQNLRDVDDVLRASNVDATLFLQTRYVGEGDDMINKGRMLTLLANGYDIQSNAHSGDDLRSLTNSQVKLELSQSKQILEEMTQESVFAVAYPMGGVNQRVETLARETGYLLGVSSEPGQTFAREELLSMPSITVEPDMSAERVVSLIEGEEREE